jgi:hypothetical protein
VPVIDIIRHVASNSCVPYFCGAPSHAGNIAP